MFLLFIRAGHFREGIYFSFVFMILFCHNTSMFKQLLISGIKQWALVWSDISRFAGN